MPCIASRFVLRIQTPAKTVFLNCRPATATAAESTRSAQALAALRAPWRTDAPLLVAHSTQGAIVPLPPEAVAPVATPVVVTAAEASTLRAFAPRKYALPLSAWRPGRQRAGAQVPAPPPAPCGHVQTVTTQQQQLQSRTRFMFAVIDASSWRICRSTSSAPSAWARAFCASCSECTHTSTRGADGTTECVVGNSGAASPQRRLGLPRSAPVDARPLVAGRADSPYTRSGRRRRSAAAG